MVVYWISFIKLEKTWDIRNGAWSGRRGGGGLNERFLHRLYLSLNFLKQRVTVLQLLI